MVLLVVEISISIFCANIQKNIRIRLFLDRISCKSSCLALQAVPRGSRDGEVVNKRRATVAHEAGNECPN